LSHDTNFSHAAPITLAVLDIQYCCPRNNVERGVELIDITLNLVGQVPKTIISILDVACWGT